jgi:uncharacterized phage protein (TIGR02218 family)
VRSLPAALQDHLDTGATTLCWCWRITRNDGVGFGFTDHDRELTFDETAFEAVSGFTGTEIAGAVGLNVDAMEVETALQSDRLTEDDLIAGLYDNALIEIWRVNWDAPEQRVLIRYGNLGEVSRGRHYFKAEVRGLAHALQQAQGRIIQYACDADLGDARCKVDLDSAAFKGSGAVAAVDDDPRRFTASGIGGFANDFFTRGLLRFTSGANDGLTAEVKTHLNKSGTVTLVLWQAMPNAIAVNDAFTVTAGCDKAHSTCRKKFGNYANYRGFPHVPGTDFALSYVRKSDKNDGGRLK